MMNKIEIEQFKQSRNAQRYHSLPRPTKYSKPTPDATKPEGALWVVEFGVYGVILALIVVVIIAYGIAHAAQNGGW